MNELKLQLDGISINKIIENIDSYSDEAILAAYDFVRKINSDLRYKKLCLSKTLIDRMTEDQSTKAQFVDVNGEKKIASLKKGVMQCDHKHADMEYKDAGFDPLEIGEYTFKPIWSKAKKAIKFGGEKKKILEKLFKETSKSIEID